ncbi:hypothetical protein DRE_03844 [Drechslerella stenobrocha 248]|uniref:Mitochondrial intermediate peptidase n=1 Tax=Drechslerella stenobrocha 248 TaxID=1043628 RepID=W7I369_9PEZI|nr:hypothetical protein DRE_03844 [Drechslerella stenobrocha 248]
MQGLSRLFSHLYGVRFAPAATAPGEVWHDDVRRLDVLSDTDGHIAVVYCDLFQRAGKNPNPAHFTVRCSREILPADIPHDNDGMATAPSASGALYQLPTIALICDFSSSPSTTGTNTPPLLAFHEVTTLFHEMGHAIHSILGRTAYHEVAGTRCATDFAELPSILMEHFAHSPAVLALFARHHATDAPLPQELLRRRMLASTHLEHSETYQQALLALLDQELHAGPPMEIASSTRVYAQLEAEHALLAPGYVPGTAWQGFFTHLFGYGGLYYSYLLDKAIADRVWTAVFANDPLSRDAGERYREEVLRWGGARDPWRCVGSLLAREDLAEEAAVAGRMEEVGRWGIKEQIK